MVVPINTLILHPGLPKTGTTFIQKTLLKHQDWYLGKGEGSDPCTGLDTLKKLRDIIVVEGPSYWKSARSRAFRQEIQEVGDFYRKRTTFLFISFEMFLFPPFFDAGDQKHRHHANRPLFLAHHLHKFVECLAPDVDSLKTVVTTRNQPEWFASLYSQFSNREKHPGQMRFEAKVRAYLSSSKVRHKMFLEWDSIASHLLQLSPVSLLPFEKLEHPDFLKHMFAGLPDGLIPGLAKTDPAHANKRSLGQDWELRKGSEPKGAFRLFRRNPLRQTIYLSPELQKEVEDRCAPHNTRALHWAPIGLNHS